MLTASSIDQVTNEGCASKDIVWARANISGSGPIGRYTAQTVEVGDGLEFTEFEVAGDLLFWPLNTKDLRLYE